MAKLAIYFETDEEKKKQFDIALALSGQTKTVVLNEFIEDYIKKVNKQHNLTILKR